MLTNCASLYMDEVGIWRLGSLYPASADAFRQQIIMCEEFCVCVKKWVSSIPSIPIFSPFNIFIELAAFQSLSLLCFL